jgi:hypothetical protein
MKTLADDLFKLFERATAQPPESAETTRIEHEARRAAFHARKAERDAALRAAMTPRSKRR